MQFRAVWVCLIVLFVSPLPSLAHSPLKMTIPENGAKVMEAPEKIVLEFGKQARLIKVVLNDPKGSALRLNIPAKSFETQFQLDANIQKAGNYEVEWRAISNDGHIIKGTFSFEVQK